MKKFFSFATRLVAFAAIAIAVVGCKDNSAPIPEPSLNSILVFNEGNFGSSTAEITGYNPDAKVAVNNVFAPANNGAPLGDSPTHSVVYNDRVYITLSGSGKIYAINPDTYVLEDKITELSSPRYIEILSDTKGYITNLNEGTINIFNPSTSTLTGTISVESPAEQMVVDGNYLYTNLWSYGKNIVKIDTRTDKVVQTLEVGIQPKCLLKDKNGNLWTLCDGGGWDGNPIGFEAPSIVKVTNFEGTMVVGKRYSLPSNFAYGLKMIINRNGDKLYVICGSGVYAMSIDAEEFSSTPMFEIAGTNLYGIAENPYTEELYISDAVDYVQRGTVYRYSNVGVKKDSFQAGICPAVFVF